ncbi:MAG TPA: hypothetical protein VMW01_03735 [Williamwhitmania sp.]|nr:hypothetical protein [Williamwhitmania sp.]
MLRKNVVALFVALLLLVVGVVYVFTIFYNKENSSEPIAAIPLDASVVMRFTSTQQLFGLKDEGSEFKKLLAGTDWYEAFEKEEKSLTVLFTSNDILRNLYTSSPLFISIHPFGRGGNKAAFYLQIPPEVHSRDLEDLTSFFTTKGIRVESSKYQGSDVIHLMPGKAFVPDVYFVVANRIAIISSSRMIVEAALRQLSSGESLLKSDGFKTLWKTLGDNVSVNMLVNGRNITSILQPLLGSAIVQRIQLLNKFTDWIAVDGFMHSNAFIANGFTLASDSTNRFFRIFLHQSPLPVKVSELLPASVACFVSYQISDINGFIADYNSYLDKENKLYAHNARLKEWEQGGNFSIDRFMRVGKTNSIVSLYYRDVNIAGGGCWLNLYGLNDPETAKLLAKENLALLKKETGKQPIAKEALIGKERVPIYNLPSSDFSEAMFKGLVFPFAEDVAAFYQNYFITASDQKGLESFLNALNSGDKLKATSSYQSVLPYVASMGNIFFYLNPVNSSSLLSVIEKSPLQQELAKTPELLNGVGGIGIQFRSLKGKLFTNFFITTPAVTTSASGSPNAEWTFKADTVISSKPYIFKDYKTKQQQLVFTDNQNQLNMLKSDGTLLWKKKIDDHIVGDIQCVDYFRNHKYQLFFTTKRSVYLIDRNGEVVDGFPILLPSPATAMASFFDYDNNGENRIFVPVADGRVLLYDKSGKEIKGWKFTTTGGVVSAPVDYFRIKGKDYITIHDGLKFYFLDRRGRDRIKVDRSIVPAANAKCYLADNNSDFMLPSSAGEIVWLNTDGKSRAVVSSQGDNAYYFIFADLNGNMQGDVIIADGNQINVSDGKGNKMFSVKVDGDIDSWPEIVNGAKGRKYILVHTNKEKSYMVNSNGTIFSGFPLESSIYATYVNLDVKSATFGMVSVTSSGEVQFFRFKE